MSKYIASPGSEEAIQNGCECPVKDNARGQGLPSKDGPLFYYDLGCKYHKSDTIDDIRVDIGI